LEFVLYLGGKVGGGLDDVPVDADLLMSGGIHHGCSKSVWLTLVKTVDWRPRNPSMAQPQLQDRGEFDVTRRSLLGVISTSYYLEAVTIRWAAGTWPGMTYSSLHRLGLAWCVDAGEGDRWLGDVLWAWPRPQ
jgi:hypothetical protein